MTRQTTTVPTENLGGLFTEPATLTGRAGFFADAPNNVGGKEAALEYLRRWHDDHHPGAFTNCLGGPCYGLQQLL